MNRETPNRKQDDGLLTRGLKGMVNLGVEAAKLPLRVAQPIVMSDVLAPARNAANAAVASLVDASASVVGETVRGNDEIMRLASAIAARLLIDLRGSELLAVLLRVQAEHYFDYLRRNPEVIAPLVEVAAGTYVHTLKQNPALLRPLVQALGDDYVEYLARNPGVVNATVEALAEDYIEHTQTKPELLDELVRTIGARYLTHLASEPALLDKVVEKAAQGYLAKVEADPALLDEVVQQVGDRYLTYLHTEPEAAEAVQDLLQGQSLGLADSMMQEVRERTSSADYAVESAFRRFFGRTPRESGG